MCMAEQCKHLLCFDEIFGVEISDVSSWQCFVYLNNFKWWKYLEIWKNDDLCANNY